MVERLTIAIDGPAAAGKTTVGKLVADQLRALAFDTGVLYRAIAWAILHQHVDSENEECVAAVARSVHIDVRAPSVEDGRLQDVVIDGQDQAGNLRSAAIDRILPKVAANAGVRRALLEQQRRIADQGRIVMLGRDIGTVIIPDADFKFFLDADIEDRARRRYAELAERGAQTTYAAVLADMQERDRVDSTRLIAPLRMADDAVRIETGRLTAAEVAAEIVTWATRRDDDGQTDGELSQ